MGIHAFETDITLTLIVNELCIATDYYGKDSVKAAQFR